MQSKDELSHSGTTEQNELPKPITDLGKIKFSNGLFWPVLVGKNHHDHRDNLLDQPQHCHVAYVPHKRID